MPDNKQNTWRDKFDKKFTHPTRDRNFHKSGLILYYSEGEEIKSFIAKTLSHQKQEILDELERSELQGVDREYRQGFNEALRLCREVINNISLTPQ